MVKKKQATVNGVSLDEVFAKYPKTHSVSFEQLKEILVALSGADDTSDDYEPQD